MRDKNPMIISPPQGLEKDGKARGTFRADAYPFMGVGIEYKMRGADDRVRGRLLEGRLDPFDYVELQPPHFILLPELYRATAHVPTLIHVSQLSLGSIGIPMDEEFLRLTKRLLDNTRSPWVSEHISWSRFQGGDTRHFMLPFLGQEVARVISSNAKRLARVTGLPVLLENCPRTFALDEVRGDQSEKECRFIRRVLVSSGSGLLLDVDSAIQTAESLKYDLWEYLRALPLERLIEVHVGDPIRQSGILRYLLRSGCPVKAVSIDSDFLVGSKKTGLRSGDEVASVVGGIKKAMMAVESAAPGVYGKKGGHTGKSSNELQPRQGISPRPLEETRLRLNDLASFAFRGDRVSVQDLENGVRLDFPHRLFPFVKHFSDWRPVFSAFVLAGDSGADQAEVFELLRALMRAKVLITEIEAKVSEGRRKKDKGAADEPSERQAWSKWGAPSMAFYLATRTRADEPYLSLEESEARLRRKSKTAPQPSAFKDYAAHPFHPLSNPLSKVDEMGEEKSFMDVLLGRRTSRSFSDKPMTSDQLSRLLYFTWGATAASKNSMGEDVFLRKTSPSGGSLHCVEVYPIVMNVRGVGRGVYHYSVRRHCLELLSREDPRPWVTSACGGQEWVSKAASVFVSTAVLQRSAWKYDSARALRVIMHDAGHLSQTFSLVATSMGLGAFTTAALRDEIFERKLGLDHLEEPVLLLNGVAKPREKTLERGTERPYSE